MVRKEMQFVGLENVGDHDTYHDLISGRTESTQFNDIVNEYERLLEENDNLLLWIMTQQERFKPHKRRREKDDDVEHDNNFYSEEENDPQYELFLKSLKEHEKSYALEEEKDGLAILIKYEGYESSDNDPEPRRKLRSAMKQKIGISNQMAGVENQCMHDPKTKNLILRKSRDKAKSEKVENVKCSTNETVPDPDYLDFHQNAKFVDDHFVYMYGGHRVVYEKYDLESNQANEEHDDEHDSDVEILDGSSFYKKYDLESNQVNEEHDDEHFSDVEILDRTSFYNEGDLNPSAVASTQVLKNMNKDSFLNNGNHTMQSQFRQQIIAVLRRPYDKEEYDKLWLDIEIRKPEERHKELRGGRERSCATNKDGKSYLDHHPDFRRQLLKLQDDKPKCLNLLRGFFFWLQNFLQNGSFQPWQDAECLSIIPESC